MSNWYTLDADKNPVPAGAMTQLADEIDKADTIPPQDEEERRMWQVISGWLRNVAEQGRVKE